MQGQAGMVHDSLNDPDGSGGFWFDEAVPNFNRMLFHRHSPDDIQLRGNRTTVTQPRELCPAVDRTALSLARADEAVKSGKFKNLRL